MFPQTNLFGIAQYLSLNALSGTFHLFAASNFAPRTTSQGMNALEKIQLVDWGMTLVVDETYPPHFVDLQKAIHKKHNLMRTVVAPQICDVDLAAAQFVQDALSAQHAFARAQTMSSVGMHKLCKVVWHFHASACELFALYALKYDWERLDDALHAAITDLRNPNRLFNQLTSPLMVVFNDKTALGANQVSSRPCSSRGIV